MLPILRKTTGMIDVWAWGCPRVHVCVFEYTWMCRCVCLWRSEINLECHSSGDVHLGFFRQSYSLEPGARGLDLADCPRIALAIPRILSVPTSLVLGLQMRDTTPGFSGRFWGIFPAWKPQTFWRWECLTNMGSTQNPNISRVCTQVGYANWGVLGYECEIF